MFILQEWIDINNINWDMLSLNINAIDLLTSNQEKINWDNLSCNENAIDLLKSNQEKINWECISKNKNIFI